MSDLAMTADDSVLEPVSASVIATVHPISPGTKGDLGNCSDIAEMFDVTLENVLIEKVAKLAKLYAAGPPEKELTALKDRLGAISKEVEAKIDEAAFARPRGSTQCIDIAQGGSNFSARMRAMEASIGVFPAPSGLNNGQFADTKRSIGGQGYIILAYFFVAALMGVGARFAWDHGGDQAKETARTLALSLSWSALFSGRSSRPSSVRAAPATPREVAQQLDHRRFGFAAARHATEQLEAKKEQISHSRPTTLQRIEHDIPKISSPPLHHSNLAPTPEARPTTLEGWTLHEVSDGVATLEGPNGVWKVKRGDTVPGVGRVESIVRWGNNWIVATSHGLISTP
jgi:hypothetical protein